MMDDGRRAEITERMAQSIAEAMNGGEFYDGKWYTEGHRNAWIKAVTPWAALLNLAPENNSLTPLDTPSELY